MLYKIYTDRNEDFICEVSVKNASLKGSIIRLIVESNNGPTLVFNGKLDGDKCVVPIKRLKGLMEENERGNIHLEVIIEDTYFRPWESDFIVEEHTSVKVKVNEQKYTSNKPVISVKPPNLKYPSNTSIERKNINIFIPKKEIAIICEIFGIKKNNFKKKHKDFIQILKEYFNNNSEYNNHKRTILSGIDDFLR